MFFQILINKSSVGNSSCVDGHVLTTNELESTQGAAASKMYNVIKNTLY